MLCGCTSTRSGMEATSFDYPSSPAVKKDEVLFNHFGNEVTDGYSVYLDYGMIEEGYLGAAKKEECEVRVKLRISKDEKIYTYDVNDEKMKAFPLNMEDGIYSIRVYEQIKDKSYALVYSEEIDVRLNDMRKPYLYPNQIVDYDENSLIVDKALEVTENDDNDLKRLYSMFIYTVETLSYDNQKAKEAESSYMLPDLEGSIERGSGICFDYAAILCAMCRIEKIPARLIVGYTDIDYHAWVEVYLEEYGWINPKMIFNSGEWTLIDPTFADTDMEYEGLYDEVYRY